MEVDERTFIPSLAKDICPDCGGVTWRRGPRGGLSQNMECRQCKARFNVTWFKGHLIAAEPIPSEADGGSHWREDWFPR